MFFMLILVHVPNEKSKSVEFKWILMCYFQGKLIMKTKSSIFLVRIAQISSQVLSLQDPLKGLGCFVSWFIRQASPWNSRMSSFPVGKFGVEQVFTSNWSAKWWGKASFQGLISEDSQTGPSIESQTLFGHHRRTIWEASWPKYDWWPN